MSFSLYLKNKISINKINRSDLIAQLNLYHHEFSNLDAITLSRWVTNKTSPSPYKQILISKYFQEDLLVFIKKHITIKKESKNIEVLFDKVMNNIEYSYSNISYFHSNEEPQYIVDIFNEENYEKLFSDYYKNFTTYQELNKICNKQKIKKNRICVLKRKKDIISSHISLFKLDQTLSKMMSDFFNVNIDSEIFINLGYIENRESYLFMTSLLYYFFYKNSIENFTCLIRSEFLEFLTALPFKQIGTAYIDNGRKLYLIQGNFHEIISAPFIRRHLIKFLSDYDGQLDDFFSDDIIIASEERKKLIAERLPI
ncbi:TPA: hypothetical protein ACX6S8_000885 [Photobacterium damselae]|uniref:hypothetical protein n=1 Tax=Photobacterium damselae TaxID=38293 RepID=UPI001593286D|nr:hypothetical protein [Photobacterium damselae]NVH48449.1 hypothetical protein [Photobacterium damselae subsp. damselae]